MAKFNTIEEEVIHLVNCVCFKLGISVKISKLEEVTVCLIKKCFAKLCFTDLGNDADDLSTLKKIMDTLSFQLKIPLVHLEPSLILSCDAVSLKNLFEIFSEIISIRLQLSTMKTSATEKEVLHLLNFILKKVKMDKEISSFSDINSSFFKSIFKHLKPSSIANTKYEEGNEHGNYSAMLNNISSIIQIPLTHIDVGLLARKDPMMIWKFIEIIVGFREGFFNTKKLNEVKKLEEEVVTLANDILCLIDVPRCIKNFYEVNDEFFLRLLEIRQGSKCKGTARPAKSDEERVKNMEVVLRGLAGEIRGPPFGHITAADVVTGNVRSIRNLLQIFHKLMLCQEKCKVTSCGVKGECRPAAKTESDDSCEKLEDAFGVVLPTMQEVLMRCGMKEAYKEDSKQPAKPRRTIVEIMCDGDSDTAEGPGMDATDVLGRNIRNMDLNEHSREVCKNYRKNIQSNVQRELDKTRGFREILDGISAKKKKRGEIQIPFDVRNMMYWRSIVKSYNVNQNSDTDCERKKRRRRACSKKQPTQNDRYVRVEGRLMSSLLKEFPSMEVPEKQKKKVCKSFFQKEKMDAKLLGRSKIGRCDKPGTLNQQAIYRQNQKLEQTKKDFACKERLRNLRDQKCQKMRERVAPRNRKILTNRVAKQCEEIEAIRSGKELQRKSSTQQALKKCMEKRLNVEKEIQAEERRRRKEKRMENAMLQVEELESVENYYRNQFALLHEQTQKQKRSDCIKDQEVAKLLREKKYELKKNLEEEIQRLQNKLLQSDKEMIC